MNSMFILCARAIIKYKPSFSSYFEVLLFTQVVILFTKVTILFTQNLILHIYPVYTSCFNKFTQVIK